MILRKGGRGGGEGDGVKGGGEWSAGVNRCLGMIETQPGGTAGPHAPDGQRSVPSTEAIFCYSSVTGPLKSGR